MRRSASLASPADTASRRFWHPKIELWPLKKLRPSKPNARTHPKKQRDKLLGVVRQCGFINPILVDEHGTIISGIFARRSPNYWAFERCRSSRSRT